MSLYQTLYFMSLVGGMSGLFSWAIVRLVEALLISQHGAWISDLIATSVLGAFIGGLTVGFSDRYSGNRTTARWVISGTLIGLLAGLIAGLIQIPITNNLGTSAPVGTRLIAWMVAGSFIGLGLGLRWVHVNKMRAAHAYVGGLLGGLLGGLIFTELGSIADLSHALGYVVVGIGICFGVTLAPILLRDGVLQFISSGDPTAQMKFGNKKKEWELQQGDSYTIGSRSQNNKSMTRYRPDIEIFIPDAAIAGHHAILFGKEGRFYLARHPDVGGPAGLAKYVVRVRGKTVTKSQELSNADDILIGRTALKFVARRAGS